MDDHFFDSCGILISNFLPSLKCGMDAVSHFYLLISGNVSRPIDAPEKSNIRDRDNGVLATVGMIWRSSHVTNPYGDRFYSRGRGALPRQFLQMENANG